MLCWGHLHQEDAPSFLCGTAVTTGARGGVGENAGKNETGTPVKESTRFSSYEIDCLKAEEEDFVAIDATVVFQFLSVTAAGRDGGLDAEVVVVDNSER